MRARSKERLWPHIREFADNGIAHTKRMLSALGENGTPCELYSIHGHYADAGEARPPHSQPQPQLVSLVDFVKPLQAVCQPQALCRR